MPRPTPNRASRSCWVLLVACITLGKPARAAEPVAVRALLVCRPEVAPGRVLCELTVAPVGPVRLVWGDALVTRAPAFARPLRARVTPGRFGSGTGSGERRLGLAFVASENGAGPVTLLARVVLCEGDPERERCFAQSLAVTAELRVGS